MTTASNAGIQAKPNVDDRETAASSREGNSTASVAGIRRYSVFSGGLQWHIKRKGATAQDEATSVLLLHGTGSSIHSWNGLFPQLPDNFDVLAPDLPGHGDTLGAGDSELTLSGMASSLAALLSKMEFKPELLIGHSAGAAIALKMGCEGTVNPRLIVGINAALLPYGGRFAPVFRPIAKAFASMPGLPGLVASRARKPGAVERLISGTGSKLGEEEVGHYRHLLSSQRHVTSTLTMMANWRLEGLLHDFQRTGIPLTLLVAEQDRMVEPWQAENACEIATQTRLIHLSGLGHLAHEEDPKTVATTLLDAWTEVSKG
ncbi:MAG TPA: alpha/beta fold hydrolase BchO [Xanthomonadales bacterium]|nr:alpha/beta fold hydrolase BchO [Xanthomonadales bacterium]